jgi:organic hydroperoxide reductase OsmC/OhrA
MAGHVATVNWTREGAAFTDQKFSRSHAIGFDGGVSIAGSASPSVVKAPYSREDAADPEEMFVASLAACHMLWFLSLAAARGFVVDSYRDEAVGVMARNERGKSFVAKVTLRPHIEFSGAKRPTAADLDALHHKAHEECFIANSVRAEIAIEPAG